jgi:hypothetical protein
LEYPARRSGWLTAGLEKPDSKNPAQKSRLKNPGSKNLADFSGCYRSGGPLEIIIQHAV